MAVFLSAVSIIIALFIIYLHECNKKKYDELSKSIERGFIGFVIIFIDFLVVLLSFAYQNILKIQGLLPLLAILFCNSLMSIFIKVYSHTKVEKLYKTIILSFIFSIIMLAHFEKDITTFNIMLVYFLGFIISIKIYKFDFKSIFSCKEKFLENFKVYLCKIFVSFLVVITFIFLYYKISFIEYFFKSYVLWISIPPLIVVTIYVVIEKIRKKLNHKKNN